VEKFEADTVKAGLWAKAEGYTLSGIKVLKMASDETTCFEANVLQGGKKIGIAHNAGQGGSTMVDVSPRLSNDEAEMLERFIDHAVEEHEENKWIEAQAKSAQKRGCTFVMVYKKGSHAEIVSSFEATLELAKADAAKASKIKTEPMRVFDFSATAAKTQAEAAEAKYVKWKSGICLKYKALNVKFVVFHKKPGTMSASPFTDLAKAEAFAKTVTAPDLVTL
jgi:hypothetical protein